MLSPSHHWLHRLRFLDHCYFLPGLKLLRLVLGVQVLLVAFLDLVWVVLHPLVDRSSCQTASQLMELICHLSQPF